MMSLYKTLVRPHVEYCVSAWNPHYIKDKKLIEKVQRRFTKMINNMKGKTYEERLQCLKLWSLEERRNRQDLIEVSKICNGLSRIKLNELFTLDDNIKGTRGHSWKLAKFRCTQDCCKYFFSNTVIIRWNQLDQRVVGATSISAFKGCLNKIRETRMASSWTDPLSPRPPWLVFWLARPHEVSTWNGLPQHVTSALSLPVLRARLIYLFSLSFP